MEKRLPEDRLNYSASHRKVLNPPECSIVLSLEGEGQVWHEKEKSAPRRAVSRSSTLSHNASKQRILKANAERR
ncbi:hypothetical protein H5410_002536 [Solanum commersonii]|uniref:Uncharacterized protein n=1 Tax=Solanum commersonii TaxID=4109 RepID=A0A9J6B2J2_SOLCO|nr:hypothetical protein H5410_002536 [Solanum commersonii]